MQANVEREKSFLFQIVKVAPDLFDAFAVLFGVPCNPKNASSGWAKLPLK